MLLGKHVTLDCFFSFLRAERDVDNNKYVSCREIAAPHGHMNPDADPGRSRSFTHTAINVVVQQRGGYEKPSAEGALVFAAGADNDTTECITEEVHKLLQ